MALSATADSSSAGIRDSLHIKKHHARLRRVYDQTKSAAKLALKHREAIKQGDFSSILLYALPFALVKDGLFDFIFIVGNVFGVFISVYLFIFLFGKVKWKVRLIMFVLSCFDLIPAVNLIPFQTICVLYVYFQAKKDFKEAEEKRAQEEKQLSESLIREERMQEAHQATRKEKEWQQGIVPKTEHESKNQNQESPPRVPSLASDSSYAGYKQPDWMRDKSVDEAMPGGTTLKVKNKLRNYEKFV